MVKLAPEVYFNQYHLSKGLVPSFTVQGLGTKNILQDLLQFVLIGSVPQFTWVSLYIQQYHYCSGDVKMITTNYSTVHNNLPL